MSEHTCGPNCTPGDGRTFACIEVIQRTEGGSTVTVMHLTPEAKQGLTVGTGSALEIATPPVIGYRAKRVAATAALMIACKVVVATVGAQWFMWPLVMAAAIAFTESLWSWLAHHEVMSQPDDQVPSARVVRR